MPRSARAKFTRDARFGGVQFTGDAVFDRAEFTGHASFSEAKFSRDARFVGTQFFRDIPEFELDKDMRPDAMFDDAQFENATSFGPLAADYLRLDRAVFGRPVVITVAARIVSCCYVTWSAGVDLQLRFAVVHLAHASFTVPSSVTGSDRPFELPPEPSDWGGAPPQGEPSVRFEDLEKQVCGRIKGAEVLGEPDSLWAPRSLDQWMPRLSSLSGLDAANLSLTDVDLSKCQFAGAQLLDQLRLEGRCIFDHPPRRVQTGVARPNFRSRSTAGVLSRAHWPDQR